MPNFTKEQLEQKQKLTEELQHNIAILETKIPGFKVTPEQMAELTSDRRFEAYFKAQDYPTADDMMNTGGDIAEQHFARTGLHKAFGRNYFHMVKRGDTEEARQYNEKLFHGITRDDAIGEQVRTNYIVKALNSVRELDVDKLLQITDPVEMLEFCAEHREEGGIAMETEHFMTDTGMKVSDERMEEYKIYKNIGSDVGMVFRGATEISRSKFFITLPLSIMTEEQRFAFGNLHGSLKTGLDIPVDSMTAVSELLGWYKGMDRVKADYPSFRPILDTPPYTPADLEFKNTPDKRYMGGIDNRVEALKQYRDAFDNMPDIEDEEIMSGVKAELDKLIDLFDACGNFPNPEQQAGIVAQAKNLQAKFQTYMKEAHAIGGDVFQKAKVAKGRIEAVYSPFTDGPLLKDYVTAKQEDMDIGDPEVSKFLDGYRVKNEYSESRRLSGDELAEIRTYLASAIAAKERMVESAPNIPAQAALNASAGKLKELLTSINRAIPGQTLEEALAGAARRVDLSGQQLQKMGANWSSRQMMTLTGPDGSKMRGFFTEAIPLSAEAKQKEMVSSYMGKHPQYAGLMQSLMETAFGYSETNSPKEIKARAEAFIAAHAKEIAEPEAFQNIAEGIFMEVSKYQRSADTYLKRGASEGSSIDARNVAMSDVAMALGVGDIIARSTPMELVNGGNVVHGTFMEKAVGEDINHYGPDSKLFNMRKDALDRSPALKQLCDLQVLDYICGNTDRHTGNMLYQMDDDGHIIGVMGIDNDMSFQGVQPDENEPYFTKIEGMRFVSASMAEKVNNMKPDDLRTILAGSKLGTQEMDAAVKRLTDLQAAIKSGNPSVLPDEEFLTKTMDEVKSPDLMSANYLNWIELGVMNTFVNIKPQEREKLMAAAKERMANEKPETELDFFEDIGTDAIRQDIQPLNGMLQKLSDATKNVFGGSSEYEKVQTALQTVKEASAKMGGDMKLATETTFKGLQTAYLGVQEKCEAYLERKRKQGKLDADGNIQANEKTSKRIKAVQEVLKFCKNKTAVLEETIHAREMSQMQKESDRIMIDNMTPEVAGNLIKTLNEISRQANQPTRVYAKAGEQLQIVARYMKEKGVKPEDCDLKPEDMLQAKETIEKGRAANAEMQKAKEAPVQQAGAMGI